MRAIDPDRAQILRQRLGRALIGYSIHDGVGAIEMLIVDVLTGLPGMDEIATLAAFDAIASDVRNIIHERFAAEGTAH